VRVVLVDCGERHRHTDNRAALHGSDQSDKRVASWTGKSSNTPDTHYMLRTSSRGCHEDATRKTVSWNLSFTEQTNSAGSYSDEASYLAVRGGVDGRCVSCKQCRVWTCGVTWRRLLTTSSHTQAGCLHSSAARLLGQQEPWISRNTENCRNY